MKIRIDKYITDKNNLDSFIIDSFTIDKIKTIYCTNHYLEIETDIYYIYDINEVDFYIY